MGQATNVGTEEGIHRQLEGSKNRSSLDDVVCNSQKLDHLSKTSW